MNWKQSTLAAAAALSIAGGMVYAQPSTGQTSPSMGGGMMTGDPGGVPSRRQADADRGGIDWDDMGPGMMRGGATGPGVMRGGGMGPGMMPGDHAWGMGGGMMDGMGMMGPGLRAIGRLDLSDTQRQQIQKIDDELRRKNWDAMGKMHDEMARMRDAMWAADKRDRTAILASNKRMSDLRQLMLENALDAADRAETLLTPQQREQVRRSAP